MSSKSSGQYPTASKLATAAFVLSNLSVVMTLLLWVMIVGLIVAYTDNRAYCYGIRYDQYSGTYRKWRDCKLCMTFNV